MSISVFEKYLHNRINRSKIRKFNRRRLGKYLSIYPRTCKYLSNDNYLYISEEKYMSKDKHLSILFYYKDLFTHKDINTYINGVV